MKPTSAYADLKDKRLANRVIMALAREELDDKAQKAIARCVNKARRATSPTTAKKKYINGWLVFYKDRFQKVRKANPEIDVTAIATMIGQEWRKLSVSEKGKYTQKARELRDEK